METGIKVSGNIHGRLKAKCAELGIPLKSGTNSLLEFALDALDRDEIAIRPVTVEREGAQHEEASV